MMQEFDSRLNLWELTRHLWTDYVGASDEYRMLKAKWLYLVDELYPALPNLKGTENETELTFDVLDRQIVEINLEFLEYFNLNREEPDDVDKFKMGTIEQYSNLERRVSDIAVYVGLMKLAFYQRTVSVEIPHVTAGYPHSPERTVGNELIYVAADKVANVYTNCLDRSRHPNLPKWDGFVTYVPPITEELSLGAFCDITPYGLVRLFLSERHKPDVSPYLLLAHEIGHIPVIGLKPRRLMRTRYERLAESIVNEIHCLKNIKGRDRDCSHTQKCEFYPCEATRPENLSVWKGTLMQVFADIFAILIGGPTPIEVLLNETLISFQKREVPEYVRNGILIRLWNAVQYMSGSYLMQDRSRIVERRLNEVTTQYIEEKDFPFPCFDCLEQIGRRIGKSIKDSERKNTSEFKSFIRKGKTFSISQSEEREIMDILLANQICTNEDPRKILHCYFLASLEAEVFKARGEGRVSFASILHSLAYSNPQ